MRNDRAERNHDDVMHAQSLTTKSVGDIAVPQQRHTVPRTWHNAPKCWYTQ